jgi:molybdopterin converting factor small subunit
MSDITVVVRYWAAARRAAGVRQEMAVASTLADLIDQLAARPELERVIAMASFLVDGQRVDPFAHLTDGAVVDVLPPFAGG